MRSPSLLIVLVLLVACGTGCQPLARINWSHPGPIDQQQFDAHRFDPYPNNDVGPPVVGGRPRGFTTPPSDVYQGRWRTIGGSWWDRGAF